VVNLRRLRVAVATPDPALTAHVADVIRRAGHDVTVAADAPLDAMEAAFSRSVEVLVLDQQLRRLPATDIADLVRSVGTSVTVVVLHRGELAAGGDLVLDPTGPGFDDALTDALGRIAGVVADPPPEHEGRRAG